MRSLKWSLKRYFKRISSKTSKIKRTPPTVVHLAKYEGYKEYTRKIHERGSNSRVFYNSSTGEVSVDPGSPSFDYKETTGYSVNFTTPNGKTHNQSLDASIQSIYELPKYDIGTIGTLVYDSNRFQFNILDDQEKAEKEYQEKAREAKLEQEKAKQEIDAKRNTPHMRVLRSIFFFVRHMFPTFVIANLSIVMPQLITWFSNNGENLIIKSNLLLNIITGILMFGLLLLSIPLMYFFYYGHILAVPMISCSTFKKDYQPSKRFLIILVGLIISYFTGSAIESKLTELGIVLLNNTPFLGSQAKTVICCGLVTNVFCLILGYINKHREQAKKEYDKLFNQK